jgi:uncharacterized protein YwgA
VKRLQRAALLTELADRMTRRGSWCGETHVQKSSYFLQHLLDVPLDYDFIFYKFGPYSFDLSSELAAMEADELVKLRVRHPGYGPTIVPTEDSKTLRERYPITLGKYEGAVEFVSQKLGTKTVTELERLATALYVSRESGADSGVSYRAKRICELKPHIGLEDARAAVAEYDRIAAEAKTVAVGESHE